MKHSERTLWIRIKSGEIRYPRRCADRTLSCMLIMIYPTWSIHKFTMLAHHPTHLSLLFAVEDLGYYSRYASIRPSIPLAYVSDREPPFQTPPVQQHSRV